MNFFSINKKKVIISLVIAGIAVIGDKNSENNSNYFGNAVCDNLTHGFIGAFTWFGIFIAKTYLNLPFFSEVIVCGILSSLIDVDHFITAKSLYLKDATNLKSRPFFHCTTLAIVIVLSMLSLSYFFKINWLCKFGWIVAAAFLSHHIRDSKRRGFWFWPFGSTAPTPNFLYIVAQMLLPHFFSILISYFPFPRNDIKNIQKNIETV